MSLRLWNFFPSRLINHTYILQYLSTMYVPCRLNVKYFPGFEHTLHYTKIHAPDKLAGPAEIVTTCCKGGTSPRRKKSQYLTFSRVLLFQVQPRLTGLVGTNPKGSDNRGIAIHRPLSNGILTGTSGHVR